MITWDNSKRDSNLKAHGIDLAELADVFDAPMVTTEDARAPYGEQRLQSLAFWRGRVVVLVWTGRGESARIISCRNGNKYETHAYFKVLHI